MGKPVIGARSTLLPFDVNETQGSSFMQQRTSWRHPRMQPLDSTFSAICKLRNSSQCIYSYTSPHWSTLTTPRNQSSSYCFCLDTGRRLCRRHHHYSNPLRVRLVAALPHVRSKRLLHPFIQKFGSCSSTSRQSPQLRPARFPVRTVCSFAVVESKPDLSDASFGLTDFAIMHLSHLQYRYSAALVSTHGCPSRLQSATHVTPASRE
jgi:hypothetical protein